jgi:hypothetical protein
MFHDLRRARFPILLALAGLALLALASAGVALAGNGERPPSPTATATAGPAGGPNDPFDAAVQALVQAGTIDQHQADAVRQQLVTGRIDPQQWTDSGLMTAAQARAVATRPREVKESLAPGGRDAGPLPSPNPLKVRLASSQP